MKSFPVVLNNPPTYQGKPVRVRTHCRHTRRYSFPRCSYRWRSPHRSAPPVGTRQHLSGREQWGAEEERGSYNRKAQHFGRCSPPPSAMLHVLRALYSVRSKSSITMVGERDELGPVAARPGRATPDMGPGVLLRFGRKGNFLAQVAQWEHWRLTNYLQTNI